MGQISRAKRSQRARRQDEKKIKIVKNRLKDRIDQSLRETVCMHHNFKIRDEGFMESQDELCEVVACSEEIVELELNKYFPVEGMTLTVIGKFMEWLATPNGESIQPVCLPWCRKLGQLVMECNKCRGGAPKEAGEGSVQDPRLVRLRKAKAVVDFILSGEPTNPMRADPDVMAMTSEKTKEAGKRVAG